MSSNLQESVAKDILMEMVDWMMLFFTSVSTITKLNWTKDDLHENKKILLLDRRAFLHVRGLIWFTHACTQMIAKDAH